MRTYVYDLKFKSVACGLVYARNVRAARRLLRNIFRVRVLPAKSAVYARV